MPQNSNFLWEGEPFEKDAAAAMSELRKRAAGASGAAPGRAEGSAPSPSSSPPPSDDTLAPAMPEATLLGVPVPYVVALSLLSM